ncbi:fatty acid desaturase [uncultured Alsobacter sp.]|uniref:fatty acid desaturase family protein n=1 Tax=uncultured Alsobacter sp. TaxID=1748258 RepID=UPI0025E848DE|nr:fatty acid desaturase [uncultured Alsobacter sp.]
MFVLRHSRWDWIPVLLATLHFVLLLGFAFHFATMTWPAVLLCGLVYAVSVSWSINSISHNFIHNAYFKGDALNAAFSMMLSLTIGFSQAMYHFVHMRHHSGNSDLPDADGDTVDYLSIYRHGKDGQPENVWRYTFLSFFRDDPKEILARMEARHAGQARQAKVELACLLFFVGLLAVVDWRFVLFIVPFNYLGQSLSSLNGYYEHFGGDPSTPLAWGVSTYHRLYNWTWMNNGYHAEHHYRPKMHWTRMPDLHRQIQAEQAAAGTRVIRPPHPLGFLEDEPGPRQGERAQDAPAASM